MKVGPFKGQNVPWRLLNSRISKKFLNERLLHLNNGLDLFQKIFEWSSIYRPSGYILAFKRPNFHSTALFWFKGSLKSSSGCYNSIFGFINFLVCNSDFPATLVAFLVFMTLKLNHSSFGRAVNVPVFHAGDPGSKQDVASISFLRVYRRNATIYTTNKAAKRGLLDRLYKMCAMWCTIDSNVKIIVKHECEI